MASLYLYRESLLLQLQAYLVDWLILARNLLLFYSSITLDVK